MSTNQDEMLRILLKSLIPKSKMPEPQLDALLDYAFSGSRNGENDVVNRLSYLLDQNIPSTMQTQTAIQLELQKHRAEDTHRKVTDLERQIGELKKDHSPTPLKWQVVQGIFTAISFISSIVALLKAFGIITFF
jgi:hypothetical protein